MRHIRVNWKHAYWDLLLPVILLFTFITVINGSTETTAPSFIDDRPRHVDFISDCPSLCQCNVTTKVVNCSNRSLRNVPHDIPIWVNTLSLRNNKITNEALRTYNFNKLKHLEKLDLGDNRIGTFSADLSTLSTFNTLILDHCSLETVPNLENSEINNVTHLSLSHNAISDLGQSLTKYPNLKYIDLSYNKLKTVKNTWFMHQWHLTELNMERNRIVQFDDDSFRGLASIETVKMSRNRIKNLRHLTISPAEARQKNQQACVGNLRNLRHLDLSHNAITSVQGLSFSGMCQLETINMRHNKIVKLLAGAFYGPTGLSVLQLDYNNITSISKDWLFEMASLQNLSISNNNLKAMEPGCWFYCKEMLHLNLNYNQFHNLQPLSFSNLHKLEHLSLSRNKINIISDDAFGGLTELKTLDLSYNEISSSVEDIRGAFRGLFAIKNISLRSNRILSLSSTVMEGAENLESLDLRQNDLTSIQNHTFTDMKKLTSLYIESSSFLCDCQLSWFPKWLQQKNETNAGFSSNVKVQCHYPPSLKGRKLLEVHHSEFVCGDQPLPVLLLIPSRTKAFRGENVTLECSASASITEENIKLENNSAVAYETTKTSTSYRREFGLKSDTVGETLPLATEPDRSETRARMSIVWKVDQKVIGDNDRRTRIRDLQRIEAGHVFFTSVLLLSKVTNEDDGKYSCIISNDYGHVQSEPAQLSIYEYPKFIKQPPQTITVKNGSSAIMSCSATGYPTPQILWQKDGGSEFPAARDRRLLRDEVETTSSNNDYNDEYMEDEEKVGNDLNLLYNIGDSAPHDNNKVVSKEMEEAPLHIMHVLPEDAGEYACIASSEAGQISTTVRLVILVPPTFEKPMPAVVKSVKNGNSVLQCMGTGYPQPEIEWQFENRPLNHTTRHFLAASGQLLVIVDTRLNDAGDYTCVMKNNLGTKRGTSTLKVFNDPAELEEHVGLFTQLFGNNVTLGIILICVFACVVLTSIIWLVILCYTRSHPEEAFSQGTDETELHPMDNQSVSLGSIEKGQNSNSFNSITEVDYRINSRNGDYSTRPNDAITARSTTDLCMNGVMINHPSAERSPSFNYSRSHFGSVPRHMHSSINPTTDHKIQRYLSSGNFETYESQAETEKDVKNIQLYPSSKFAAKAADPNTYEQVSFFKKNTENRLGNKCPSEIVPQNGKLVNNRLRSSSRTDSTSSSTTDSNCNNRQRTRKKHKLKSSPSKDDKLLQVNNDKNADLDRHQDQTDTHYHHKPRRKLDINKQPILPIKSNNNINNKSCNNKFPQSNQNTPVSNGTVPYNCDLPDNEISPLLSAQTSDTLYLKNGSEITR